MGNLLKLNATEFNSSMSQIEEELTVVKNNISMLRDRVSRTYGWEGSAKAEWEKNVYLCLDSITECTNKTVDLACAVMALGTDLSKTGKKAVGMLDGFVTALI